MYSWQSVIGGQRAWAARNGHGRGYGPPAAGMHDVAGAISKAQEVGKRRVSAANSCHACRRISSLSAADRDTFGFGRCRSAQTPNWTAEWIRSPPCTYLLASTTMLFRGGIVGVQSPSTLWTIRNSASYFERLRSPLATVVVGEYFLWLKTIPMVICPATPSCSQWSCRMRCMTC